jgi:hypothetical protein
MSAQVENRSRPTIVLVHGAFAESASWHEVIRRVQERGHVTDLATNTRLMTTVHFGLSCVGWLTTPQHYDEVRLRCRNFKAFDLATCG